jgi:hypothetical protein
MESVESTGVLTMIMVILHGHNKEPVRWLFPMSFRESFHRNGNVAVSHELLQRVSKDAAMTVRQILVSHSNKQQDPTGVRR